MGVVEVVPSIPSVVVLDPSVVVVVLVVLVLFVVLVVLVVVVQFCGLYAGQVELAPRAALGTISAMATAKMTKRFMCPFRVDLSGSVAPSSYDAWL